MTKALIINNTLLDSSFQNEAHHLVFQTQPNQKKKKSLGLVKGISIGVQIWQNIAGIDPAQIIRRGSTSQCSDEPKSSKT